MLRCQVLIGPQGSIRRALSAPHHICRFHCSIVNGGSGGEPSLVCHTATTPPLVAAFSFQNMGSQNGPGWGRCTDVSEGTTGRAQTMATVMNVEMSIQCWPSSRRCRVARDLDRVALVQ